MTDQATRAAIDARIYQSTIAHETATDLTDPYYRWADIEAHRNYLHAIETTQVRATGNQEITAWCPSPLAGSRLHAGSIMGTILDVDVNDYNGNITVNDFTATLTWSAS